MIFQLIVLLLVLIGAILLSFLVKEYSQFSEFLFTSKPRDRSQRREFTSEKNSTQNKVGWLTIAVLAVVLVVTILTWRTIYVIKTDTDKLDKKISSLETKKSVAVYTGKEWSVASFPWQEVIATDDKTTDLSQFEVALAENIQPYVGPSVVSLSKNQKKNNLTISIFIAGIKNKELDTIRANVDELVENFATVKEIAIVDCSLSFEDKDKKLAQQNSVYVKEDNKLSLIIDN